MPPPGRNHPCPCGSGRKHKHCCLHLASLPGPAHAYTDADRTSALGKLLRFAQRPHFTDDARFAAAVFWGGRPQELPDEQASDESFVSFQTWFAFDFMSGDTSHDTIVNQFLASPSAALTPAERLWLQRMSASAIRLYEVHQVEPGRGLTLHDLITGETVPVAERTASRQIIRWDLIAVRVIPGPEDALVLEGLPFLYPRASREPLLHDLTRQTKRLRRHRPDDDEMAVSKRLGPLFHHYWLDHVVMSPEPLLVTVEGDPLVIAEVVFDCSDPAGAATRLAAHADIWYDDIDEEFVWSESDGTHERILGRMVLTGNALTLATESEARADRGRRLLEATLGDAIRHRTTTVETLEHLLAQLDPMPDPDLGELPPEAQEMLSGFLAEHYRDWPDHPLPALAGRTPRHAARLKTQRAKVVELLKDIEHAIEQDRSDGRPAIALDWLWDDLGLTRPGTTDSRGT